MKGTPEPQSKPPGPLGEPIRKPAPAPGFRPVAGSPGIEVGPDGKLRTNLPLPKGPA